MDVQVERSITVGLRARGVDVLTAQEDGAARFTDPEILDRALTLRRVVFSRDIDFLIEGVRRQRANESFAGIIYGHALRVTIGRCIGDLEVLSLLEMPASFLNRIEYLPL
jgi:hypothetical protein